MSGPHLSPSRRLGDALHISGQLPVAPDGSIAPGIVAQTRQVIANLEAILRAEGLGLTDIVKTGVFLVRPQDFAEFSETYAAVFGAHRPARSTVVAGLVASDALIEIDAIAALAADAPRLATP